MNRNRNELVISTLKRLNANLKKSKKQKKIQTQQVPPSTETPMLFDSEGNILTLDKWITMTNNDWESQMSFQLGSSEVLRFVVLVNPPVVSRLTCFPKKHIMAGSLIVAQARYLKQYQYIIILFYV